MMIHKTQNDKVVTLALSGRLDSVTQLQLHGEVEEVFEAGVSSLIFDLSELEYISSAGLRVLMTAYKKADKLGTVMKIIGANESVKDIFQITGFPYED